MLSNKKYLTRNFAFNFKYDSYSAIKFSNVIVIELRVVLKELQRVSIETQQLFSFFDLIKIY